MANVFTFAAKDDKKVRKMLNDDCDMWVRLEQHYDDEFGLDEKTGRRFWPKRSTEELWSEYFKYVAPARQAAFEEQVRAEAKRLMVRGWEYQAMMVEARAEVAERLGFTGLRGERAYAVAVRPAPNTRFEDFYAACAKWVRRKPVQRYLCAFEQKGTSDAALGEGFHFHAIIWVSATNKTWADKATILRDTQNTFKDMAAANCIQVDYLAQSRDVDQATKYLTEYTSKDGHKAVTKDWDAKWRANMGLPRDPTDDLPIRRHLPIKSNRQVTVSLGEDAGPSVAGGAPSGYTVEEAD